MSRSIRPSIPVNTDQDFATMPEAELLALANLQPTPEWDEELSALLELNSGNGGREITADERARLDEMMAEYGQKQLLKAKGQMWASKRGLLIEEGDDVG